MLKKQIQNEIVEAINESLDRTTNFDAMMNDLNYKLDHVYNKLKETESNTEIGIAQIEKKDLHKNFVKNDVYDDFEGKDWKLNIYNSHESQDNIKYIKQNNNLSVNQITKNYFFNIKQNLNDYIFINNFFNFKKLIFFIMLNITNIFSLFMNIILFLFCFILNIGFYLVYLFYRNLFLIKIKFFKKNKILKNFEFLLNIIIFFLKTILIIVRAILNILYSLFNDIFTNINNILINETKKNIFTTILKNTINRNERSSEHKNILNEITQKSQSKIKNCLNHNLEYLKQFNFLEFVITTNNITNLNKETQEKYLNLELEEKNLIKKNILTLATPDFIKKLEKNNFKFFNCFKKINKILSNIIEKNKKLMEELSLDKEKTL